MWITLPRRPGRGIHRVLIPADFTKSLKDFQSEADFLKAVRECHAKNHAKKHASR